MVLSKIKYPNGKIKNHSYDGLTPYGTKVKKEFLILKNKKNVVKCSNYNIFFKNVR